MNLSVAIGVDQNAVVCAICASHRFINDVVAVPTSHLCDWLDADGADTVLLFPKVGKSMAPLQGLFDLYAQAFFQIDFPCRVVGVAGSFDFLVSGYRGCGGVAKPVSNGLLVFVLCCSEEMPIPIARPSKVAVGSPPFAFLRVSPPCPSPQSFEDGRITMDKGFFCSPTASSLSLQTV